MAVSETPTAERAVEKALRAPMAVAERGGGVYLVASNSGETYVVDIVGDVCECPASTHREIECKHLAAVRLDSSDVTTNVGRTMLPRDAVVDDAGVF